MTLRIHAPNPMRVGETQNVLVTSDNPGVVSLTYGAGLTGPASVTIEGTRVYGNMGSDGDYLARLGSEGNGRSNVTFLIEVDLDKTPPGDGVHQVAYAPLIMSLRYDVTRRFNWCLVSFKYAGGGRNSRIQYNQSASSGNTDLIYSSNPYSVIKGKIKYAITMGTGNVDDVAVNFYQGSRANITTVNRAVTSGTMGGDEALVLLSSVSCSKISRICSDAELDAWFSAGTIPATDREFVFAGGHEIDPAAPVIWDTSGNVTPLDLTAAQVANWCDPGMSVASTDTSPVVPYALVPVTAVATTGTTIDATRPRQGVPARASEAERIETATQVTVTVEAPLVSIGPDTDATVEAYPADVYLQLCAQPDGIVSLASDDANLAVPATVDVSGGSATVTCTASADVTGATVTATYGDTTDAASVTVAEVPPSAIPLTIGPGQTLDALVDEIYLHLTGEDGSVSISSVPAFGLSGLPAVASIVDGVATVTVRRMTAGTYTITATQGTSSASCTITIPSVLVPSDDYDLRLDLADIIEAIQVPADRSAYHYDETMKSDGEALDAEDGTFALHVIQTVDGPIIGGSTAVVLVQVAVESEPDHADMERFRAAIHETRCPAYVSSIYCESGDVTPMRGAYLVQYMMQVRLA